MSDDFTKESLLAQIVAGRDGLERALARIPEAKMNIPALHDGWSVQDVLGHLAFWQESLVSRFNMFRAGQQFGPIKDIDTINAQSLGDFRSLPLEEVRRRERESYQQVLAMIEDATPQELFEPGYFPGANDAPFSAWIPGDTWEHYEEHLPELLIWLDRDLKS